MLSKITDSVDLNTKFLSVTDRYYEHKYCTKFSTDVVNYDQRVSFHTNRICMISLAENHELIKNNEKIVKINCVIDKKINRLLNTSSGKGKRGAQKLTPDSILCFVECDSGKSYPVYSCVTGKLLEINENLVDNPNLLISKPTAEGYIALILPVLNLYDELKNSMLSTEEYLLDKWMTLYRQQRELMKLEQDYHEQEQQLKNSEKLQKLSTINECFKLFKDITETGVNFQVDSCIEANLYLKVPRNSTKSFMAFKDHIMEFYREANDNEDIKCTGGEKIVSDIAARLRDHNEYLNTCKCLIENCDFIMENCSKIQ